MGYDNLIQIPLVGQPTGHDTKVIVSTINEISVKTNEGLISEYLTEENIDAHIIIETWLIDREQVWIDVCEFNKNGCSMQTANRPNCSGGGLLHLHGRSRS